MIVMSPSVSVPRNVSRSGSVNVTSVPDAVAASVIVPSSVANEVSNVLPVCAPLPVLAGALFQVRVVSPQVSPKSPPPPA